ncbi:MAG: Gfo/Idh/MocA family oxidoreductase, partial [Candidatus Thorarchaeota archaeon]
MTGLRVGLIGTGKKKARGDAMGYAMAYQHATAYEALDDCKIVACADIVQQNAEAFAEAFNVPEIYLDYNEMLSKE